MATNPPDNVFIVSVKAPSQFGSKCAVYIRESAPFLVSCSTSTSLMSVNHVRMKSVSRTSSFVLPADDRGQAVPSSAAGRQKARAAGSGTSGCRITGIHSDSDGASLTRKTRATTTVVYIIIRSIKYSTVPERTTKSLCSSCPGSLTFVFLGWEQ